MLRTRLVAGGVGVCVTLLALFAPRQAQPHNPVTTTVRFNREVAGILGRKCHVCHGPGGMAMSLTTYDEARPWAEAIKEEILTRRMPPWPGARGYGEFSNDVGLTGRELEFLLSWIEGGAPEGEGEPPPFIDHSAHWMHGQPDAVVTVRNAATIAPDAPARFSRVVVDTGFPSARWVRAIDFKPGDRRITRAAFFTVEQTGQYLGGWTPSSGPAIVPEGTAFRVPARARLVVETLHRGVAEEVRETPTVAFYFADRPSTTARSEVMRSESRAGRRGSEGAVSTRARYTAGAPSSLIAFRPRLVEGMRSLELRLTQPGESPRVVLWIPNVRLDWQTPFVLKAPVALRRGAVLEALARFDQPARETPFSVTLIVAPASPRPATSR